MKRHVVLVGLPGSGKTTVGHQAARLLGTAFTDIDETVVSAAGMPVTEIFRVHGKARFRAMERTAMDGALAAPPHLIAPGGGWIAEPGNLAAAMARQACVVYLRISAVVADNRLGDDISRPLLAGGDRAGRLEALLAEREVWYRRAEYAVDATRQVAAVAAEVARIARMRAGW